MKKILVSIGVTLLLCLILIFYFDNEQLLSVAPLQDNINNIVGVYLENDEGKYESSSDIPLKDSGYQFNKAVCENGIEVKWNENNWSLIVPNSVANFKCDLYFDKSFQSFKEAILMNNKVNDGTPDFSKVATTDEGMFKTQDDWGESYYFRGAVTNNWVKFGKWSSSIPDKYIGYPNSPNYGNYELFDSLSACQNDSKYNENCTLYSRAGKDMYWRIVRINGNDSIRVIYAGIDSAVTTGATTQIDLRAFNEEAGWNAYVGYMYGNADWYIDYVETHENVHDSTMKQTLDSWYVANLIDYANHLDFNAGFCNDRGLSSGPGTGTDATTYASSNRVNHYNPTLKCSQVNDLFTSNISDLGNKKLSYPIGLLTVDEVMFAGSVLNSNYQTFNKSFYLYTGLRQWTMSPSHYDELPSYVYFYEIEDTGGIDDTYAYWSTGIRPVINLKGDLLVSGTGTNTDPYTIIENS